MRKGETAVKYTSHNDCDYSTRVTFKLQGIAAASKFAVAMFDFEFKKIESLVIPSNTKNSQQLLKMLAPFF